MESYAVLTVLGSFAIIQEESVHSYENQILKLRITKNQNFFEEISVIS